MNKQLLVATAFVLGKMDNKVLALGSLGLTGFGRVPQTSPAYEPMLEASLINKDGTARDSETLLEALSFVINERLDAGAFLEEES